MRDIKSYVQYARNELLTILYMSNTEVSQTQIVHPCYDGWSLGYALLEVFPIRPTVLPFQGVGIERLGKRRGLPVRNKYKS